VVAVDDDDWFSPNLTNRLLENYEPAFPLYHWIRTVIEPPRRRRRRVRLRLRPCLARGELLGKIAAAAQELMALESKKAKAGRAPSSRTRARAAVGSPRNRPGCRYPPDR
jgi:hypothetical protein